MNYFHQHPLVLSVISIASTWLFNNVVTALISNLPAPTKDSTPKYVYWFKVANTIIGNIQRAKSTAIEQSPNWKDAVDAHLANMAAVQVPQNEPPAPPKTQ